MRISIFLKELINPIWKLFIDEILMGIVFMFGLIMLGLASPFLLIQYAWVESGRKTKKTNHPIDV